MTTQNEGSSEERTEAAAGGSGSFARLRSMGEPGQDAAAKLDRACGLLRAKGMEQGAVRLRRIDEFANQVDLVTLDRLVNPERTADEFAAKVSRRVHRLHSWRNALAVAPLLVTWLALAWASIDYNRELANYPARVTKPFLLLWQEHFGGKHIPAFSSFGIFDLVLLGCVFAFTIWVSGEEARLTKQQNQIADLVDSAMSDLAVAISSGLGRAPANAQEWAESASRIITEAMDMTKQLATTGRETIEQATRELAKVQTDGQEFIKTFSEEINEALGNVQEEFQQFMERIGVEVVGIIEQQMSPLLSKLDGLVTEFGRHHETYRSGVAELASGISTLSHSAEALAISASDHAKVGSEIGVNLAKVAESQRDFADQVTRNVTSMESSAKAMESTAETLRGEVVSGLKDFTGNVVAASRDLKTVEGSLLAATSGLDSSAKALSASSSGLNAVTREMRSAAAALSSAQVGFWRRIFGSRRYAGT